MSLLVGAAIEAVQMYSFRKTCGYYALHRNTNIKIMEWRNVASMSSLLQHHCYRWLGTVRRMALNTLAIVPFSDIISSGHRGLIIFKHGIYMDSNE